MDGFQHFVAKIDRGFASNFPLILTKWGGVPDRPPVRSFGEDADLGGYAIDFYRSGSYSAGRGLRAWTSPWRPTVVRCGNIMGLPSTQPWLAGKSLISGWENYGTTGYFAANHV